MDFIIENWFIIVAFLAGLAVLGALIRRFAYLPTDEQLSKVRQWLLWAVTKAESELGGGTGQLKLRTVYDMFIERFPQLAKLISFTTFSDLVDDALDEMREMLERNPAIEEIVVGCKDYETL